MSTRRITFKEVTHSVLGLDLVREGRLRLKNWSGVSGDRLPLAALGDDILNYIAATGGGGEVANADNSRGSVGVTTTSETTVVSKAADGVWKLRGMAIYGNLDSNKAIADDATVTLYDDSTVLFRIRLDDFLQGYSWIMPNPEVMTSGHTITLKVQRTSTTEGNMTYHGTIFGE